MEESPPSTFNVKVAGVTGAAEIGGMRSTDTLLSLQRRIAETALRVLANDGAAALWPWQGWRWSAADAGSRALSLEVIVSELPARLIKLIPHITLVLFRI